MSILKRMVGKRPTVELFREFLVLNYQELLNNIKPISDEVYCKSGFGKEFFTRHIHASLSFEKKIVDYFDSVEVTIVKSTEDEEKALSSYFSTNDEIRLVLRADNYEPTETSFLRMWHATVDAIGTSNDKLYKSEEFITKLINEEERELGILWHINSQGYQTDYFNSDVLFDIRLIKQPLLLRNNEYKNILLYVSKFNYMVKIIEDDRGSLLNPEWKLLLNNPEKNWEEG